MTTLLVAALMSTPNADAAETFRAIHLVPDAPGVDLHIDENMRPIVEDLRYGEAAATPLLEDGRYRVTVTPYDAGLMNGVFDFGVALRPDSQTTAALIGTADNPMVVRLSDDGQRPDPANAAVLQFVHALNPAETVGIRVGDRIGGTSLDFGETTRTYIEPGFTRVAVDTDLDGNVDLDFPIETREFTNVDLFLTQNRNGRPVMTAWYADGTLRRIPANYIQPSFLRIGHLSPDAPMIDVYVDGELAAADLDFTELEEAIRVDAGDRHVVVAEAGTNNILKDGMIAFGPGTDSMIFAYDNAASLDFGRLDARSELPVSDQQTLFQVFHAADTVGMVGLMDVTGERGLDGVDFGDQTAFRHRNGAWTLGVDTDGNRQANLTFDIPELSDSAQVTVFAVEDANGVFLQAYLDDGTAVRIDANE